MPKLTLDNLASLTNQTSAINTINENNAAIEAAIENTLSRDGSTPNSMEANLDMNGNQILNLPDPTTAQEPATKSYVDTTALNATVTIGPQIVSSRAGLKVLNTAAYTVAYLIEEGHEGTFVFRSGDYSSLVASDTQEGVYIVATGIPSSTGVWVRDFNGPLQVEWFGAKAYTQAELEALDGDSAISTRATANNTAFQAAVDLAEVFGGYDVEALGQIYVLSARLNIPQGVVIVGRGTDEWEPVFNSVRDKLWDCTTLLFKGTGTADQTFEAITSMRYGGGWIEDPDNVGEYFKLWSAYNDDASGTTPATQRQFSVAIAPKLKTGSSIQRSKYWGLRGLRVVNWSGQNGIEGHSDTNAGLGDDWDIGVCLRDTEYVWLDDVQIVGSWREFALLNVAEEGSQSSNERNKITRCKLQGRVGLGIRSMDRWDVVSATSNSVTVYWSPEHYFSPSGGTLRGSDNANYTYTGLSYSAPNLTLTGVTPDPTGLDHLRHAGTGYANTEFVDTYIYDLYHVSGDDAATLGLSDSKTLEVSGFPVRGIGMRNTKFHSSSREDVHVHLHDVYDLRMWGVQFEGSGHIIASPFHADSAATAPPPGADTRRLYIDGDDSTGSQLDLRLFKPRTAFVQSIQFYPEDDLTGAFQLRALRDNQDMVWRQRGTGGVVVANDAGTELYDLTAWSPIATTPAFLFVTAPTYGFQSGWYRSVGVDRYEFGFELHWTGLDTTDTSPIQIRPPGLAVSDTFGSLFVASIETHGWTLTAGLRGLPVATDTMLGFAYAAGTAMTYDGGEIPADGFLRVHGYYTKV